MTSTHDGTPFLFNNKTRINNYLKTKNKEMETTKQDEQLAAEIYANNNWRRQIDEKLSNKKIIIESFLNGVKFQSTEDKKRIEALEKDYSDLQNRNIKLVEELKEVKEKADYMAIELEALNYNMRLDDHSKDEFDRVNTILSNYRSK